MNKRTKRGNKTIKFLNTMPDFSISGEYSNGKIIDLTVNCAGQVCSTPVDFFPEWSIKNGKLILEFTPKYVTEKGEDTIKL